MRCAGFWRECSPGRDGQLLLKTVRKTAEKYKTDGKPPYYPQRSGMEVLLYISPLYLLQNLGIILLDYGFFTSASDWEGVFLI